MKQAIKHLKETIIKEKQILRFITIIFILGLIFGSLFINILSNDDKKLLIESVTSYFNSIKSLSKDVFGINVFYDGLIGNFAVLSTIFVLGISMVGVIAVIFILFFKGFVLGTTISSIILNYQIKGVLGAVLFVFPITIVNIFIYLFLSFFAVYVSLKFIKALLKKDSLNFKNFLGKYFLSFIISIILVIITSLADAYLTPLLLKLFTFII